ncbi:hypothetical protein [Paenibacillus sp. JJ-223]|uniref:hypothetical protein n=1 Tax=Paenibacillus sp. JJ-223 TaxID=2905647 RepID=UPI001F377077|nr:hypothetical protein [Paenibacillus sp. JJ-223]CAH1208577.1 hypothetical protein PAECIP111890_03126 [Paenibacillus sp. JJ-223]
MWMWIRRHMPTAFLLIVLALCMGGCGMFQKEQTPEEVFSRAVSGIAGKERLVFEGEAGLRRENSARFENQFKFEGKLEDHDRLTLQTRVPGTIAAAGKESGIAPLDGKPLNGKKGGFSASFARKGGKWQALSAEHEPLRGSLSRFNPIAQLENIDRMNKTIHSEYGSGRRTRILRIELAPKDAKAWAVAQLNGEMEAIRAEYLHKAAASGGKNRPAMEKELDKVWKQGEDRLMQMMQNAEVQTVYHLTVDRRSSLPLRLSSESKVSLEEDGVKKSQEALVTDVNFKSYN